MNIQKIPCPKCGLPVPMPAKWEGENQDEALCNQCHEKMELREALQQPLISSENEDKEV